MMAWGITYVAHSTLLVVSVWIVARFLRSASSRETLWKVALIAPLITATLQTAAPLRKLMAQSPPRLSLPAAIGTKATEPAHAVVAPKPGDAVIASSTPTAIARTRSISGQLVERFSSAVLLVWAAGALVMFARLLFGRAWLAHALRHRVDLLREHDRLLRLRKAMSCRAEVRLTECAEIGSPIAMTGWEIVVPAETFARLSDEQKETILAHEIAHLVRRDPLWLVVGELVKAVFFVQPLNWLVQKKVKESAEFLCDDLAIMHTRNPKALAETLAELATGLAPAPRTVAAMAEGGSNLMARVTRVLAGYASPERPLRLVPRAGIATVAIVGLAAFGPGVGPRDARPAKTAETAPNRSVSEVAPQAVRYVQQLSDGHLVQTFYGPEGYTDVRLTAKDVELTEDASKVRFRSRSGFLTVIQKADNGPERNIELRPSANLEAIRVYKVDGVEKPWDDQARLTIVSAFRAEKGYASTGSQGAGTAIEVTPRIRRADPDRKLKEWSATVHLTGRRDHVPTELSVRIDHVKYDDGTGEVFFADGAFIRVEESVGTEQRSFYRDADEMTWRGSFEDTEVSAWLIDILRRQMAAPRNVAEAMTKP